MNEATNGSAGRATSSPGVPSWRSSPVDDHADAIGERGRVLEVVGDEQVGMPSPASSSCSSARTPAFVCASSAESGSSRSSTSGSRASARASATRWRSPPESSPGRACSRCAIPNRSRYSSARVPPRVLDVLAHGQVREERVVLEDEADRRRSGGRTISASPSNHVSLVERDPTRRAAATSPAIARRTVVFPAPDGPTSATVRVDVEAQLEARKTEEGRDLFEGERCHESAILRRGAGRR